MNIDICLPKGNEKELLERAKLLGYSSVVFLYPFSSKKELLEQKKKFPNQKIGLYIKAIKPNDLKKVEQFYLDADMIAVSAQDENIVRLASENPRIDLLFEVASSSGKDSLHYRNSGLNNVIVNIAKKSKQAYGLSFRYLLEHESYARAKILGREIQNIQLSRRKIPIVIASFSQDIWQIRNPNDLQSIGKLLGLNSPQSRAGTEGVIRDILKKKEHRKSREFIAPGVRLVE
jgi:ribonuclease P/MRP protein subunit RPP1